MNKIKFVDVDIYGIRLYLCDSLDQMDHLSRQHCDGAGLDTEDKKASGLFICWRNDSGTGAALWAKSPGSLAHEIKHFVDWVAEHIGFPIDFAHDEPLAYLTRFAFDEYVKALHPQYLEWK